MALRRNFVSYQDYYCAECRPNKYKRWWDCAEKKCSCYAPENCKSCCKENKHSCESGCACHFQHHQRFASYIHEEKTKLECGDAIRFRGVLFSDGCDWRCTTHTIELGKGVYYINFWATYSSKCGGTLAICRDNQRLQYAHAYLNPCSNCVYINAMFKVDKKAKISVRNISDSLTIIEMAKLNIFCLV